MSLTKQMCYSVTYNNYYVGLTAATFLRSNALPALITNKDFTHSSSSEYYTWQSLHSGHTHNTHTHTHTHTHVHTNTHARARSISYNTPMRADWVSSAYFNESPSVLLLNKKMNLRNSEVDNDIRETYGPFSVQWPLHQNVTLNELRWLYLHVYLINNAA